MTESIAPQTAKIGGHEYRIGRLNCFEQLHVARLIAPLAPILVGQIYGKVLALIQKYRDGEADNAAKNLDEVIDLVRDLEPFLYRLSLMDRGSFESIVKTCLSCVERCDGRTFGRVMVDGNLMYADMDGAAVIQLVMAVVAREVRPFIAALFNRG